MKDKKTLKVAFIDNCFTENILAALQTEYDVVMDEKSPDIVFYGNFGLKHLEYNCVKVLFSVECQAPDFNECDYAISTCRMDFDGRNLHLPPAYSQHLRNKTTINTPITPDLAHRRFCSFIYSQRRIGAGSQLRAEFCEKLMEYKKVDCPGIVLHNMEAPELEGRLSKDWNASKVSFLGKYKFNIAFENSNCRGYMTEKLADPLLANTVPIYWGSEGDLCGFPKEAVICANDYPDLESLIARIKEIDENDEEYLRILAANPLRHGFSLSRWEEFRQFILRAADVAHCPEKCDHVHYSDMAILRMAYAHRSVLALILFHATMRYMMQRLRIRFAKGKKLEELLVNASRTKRVAFTMVRTLFPFVH